MLSEENQVRDSIFLGTFIYKKVKMLTMIMSR